MCIACHHVCPYKSEEYEKGLKVILRLWKKKPSSPDDEEEESAKCVDVIAVGHFRPGDRFREDVASNVLAADATSN